MFKWNTLLKLLFVIHLYMEKFTSRASVNVGTVLFDISDTEKDCWTPEGVLLLKSRLLMQKILPNDLASEYDKSQVDRFIHYVYGTLNAVKNVAQGRTQEAMVFALSDVIGGYLRSQLLPATKNEYYDGNIPYSEAERLYTLYSDIKSLLRTDGDGWMISRAKLITDLNKLPSLKISDKKSSDICGHFIVSHPAGKHSRTSIPVPHLDNDRDPHSISVPFLRQSACSVQSPSSAYIVEKYYADAIQCLLTTTNAVGVMHFNADMDTWLRKSVLPLLDNEDLYPAFGGVNRVLVTVQRVRDIQQRHSQNGIVQSTTARSDNSYILHVQQHLISSAQSSLKPDSTVALIQRLPFDQHPAFVTSFNEENVITSSPNELAHRGQDTSDRDQISGSVLTYPSSEHVDSVVTESQFLLANKQSPLPASGMPLHLEHRSRAPNLSKSQVVLSPPYISSLLPAFSVISARALSPTALPPSLSLNYSVSSLQRPPPPSPLLFQFRYPNDLNDARTVNPLDFQRESLTHNKSQRYLDKTSPKSHLPELTSFLRDISSSIQNVPFSEPSTVPENVYSTSGILVKPYIPVPSAVSLFLNLSTSFLPYSPLPTSAFMENSSESNTPVSVSITSINHEANKNFQYNHPKNTSPSRSVSSNINRVLPGVSNITDQGKSPSEAPVKSNNLDVSESTEKKHIVKSDPAFPSSLPYNEESTTNQGKAPRVPDLGHHKSKSKLKPSTNRKSLFHFLNPRLFPNSPVEKSEERFHAPIYEVSEAPLLNISPSVLASIVTPSTSNFSETASPSITPASPGYIAGPRSPKSSPISEIISTENVFTPSDMLLRSESNSRENTNAFGNARLSSLVDSTFDSISNSESLESNLLNMAMTTERNSLKNLKHTSSETTNMYATRSDFGLKNDIRTNAESTESKKGVVTKGVTFPSILTFDSRNNSVAYALPSESGVALFENGNMSLLPTVLPLLTQGANPVMERRGPGFESVTIPKKDQLETMLHITSPASIMPTEKKFFVPEVEKYHRIQKIKSLSQNAVGSGRNLEPDEHEQESHVSSEKYLRADAAEDVFTDFLAKESDERESQKAAMAHTEGTLASAENNLAVHTLNKVDKDMGGSSKEHNNGLNNINGIKSGIVNSQSEGFLQMELKDDEENDKREDNLKWLQTNKGGLTHNGVPKNPNDEGGRNSVLTSSQRQKSKKDKFRDSAEYIDVNRENVKTHDSTMIIQNQQVRENGNQKNQKSIGNTWQKPGLHEIKNKQYDALLQKFPDHSNLRGSYDANDVHKTADDDDVDDDDYYDDDDQVSGKKRQPPMTLAVKGGRKESKAYEPYTVKSVYAEVVRTKSHPFFDVIMDKGVKPIVSSLIVSPDLGILNVILTIVVWALLALYHRIRPKVDQKGSFARSQRKAEDSEGQDHKVGKPRLLRLKSYIHSLCSREGSNVPSHTARDVSHHTTAAENGINVNSIRYEYQDELMETAMGVIRVADDILCKSHSCPLKFPLQPPPQPPPPESSSQLSPDAQLAVAPLPAVSGSGSSQYERVAVFPGSGARSRMQAHMLMPAANSPSEQQPCRRAIPPPGIQSSSQSSHETHPAVGPRPAISGSGSSQYVCPGREARPRTQAHMLMPAANSSSEQQPYRRAIPRPKIQSSSQSSTWLITITPKEKRETRRPPPWPRGQPSPSQSESPARPPAPICPRARSQNRGDIPCLRNRPHSLPSSRRRSPSSSSTSNSESHFRGRLACPGKRTVPQIVKCLPRDSLSDRRRPCSRREKLSHSVICVSSSGGSLGELREIDEDTDQAQTEEDNSVRERKCEECGSYISSADQLSESN